MHTALRINPPYNRPMPQHPDNPEHQHEHGVVVAPSRPETARPPLYSVMLLNDDYTPMDFVIEVITRFFALDLERATQVMLHVHTRGRGVCGVFTREIAESKVAQVNEYARMNQHPLLCTMEKA
ncbi:MAG: ATP-dependent Clp protease adapter ClpS [Thermomonas sp.]